MKFNAMLAIALLTLLSITCPLSADAGDPPRSLSEIRETRQTAEAQHRMNLQNIQNGLTIQSYDSDTATMMRVREEQSYKNKLESLQRDEAMAYQALEAKQHPDRGDSARAPTSAAMPRFESQSVISYPQGQDASPTEEKPHREGEQKNVGFGTRELQF